MKEIVIIEKKILSSDYIIYPTSYINPLSNMVALEKYLFSNVGMPCELIVDLLLCNGDEFNRFVYFSFDGKCIKKDSIRIINIADEAERAINSFYKSHKDILKRGVLLPEEYMRYIL